MNIIDPITLKEASTILERSEKQVQRYIKRSLLRAEKGRDGRWYLSRREVLEKSNHPERVPIDAMTRQMENMHAKIEYLEKQLDRLSYRTDMYKADTEERISYLEDALWYYQEHASTTTPPVVHIKTTSAVVKLSPLPSGSIPAGQFAAVHGVNTSTFRDHYVKGIHGEKLHIASRQRPGRNQLEWFVEEGQAKSVLDFWDRHSVKHT